MDKEELYGERLGLSKSVGKVAGWEMRSYQNEKNQAKRSLKN